MASRGLALWSLAKFATEEDWIMSNSYKTPSIAEIRELIKMLDNLDTKVLVAKYFVALIQDEEE